jgi:uncharacterized protein YjbJ (UPF0337 family)
MNSDSAMGSLKDLKGEIKQQWAKFTDDDIAYFKGNGDEIVGKIQKVYGFSKEKAQQEFESFKKNHSQYFNNQEQVMGSANKIANTVENQYSDVKNRAGNFVDHEMSRMEPAFGMARDLTETTYNASRDLVRKYPGYAVLGAATIGLLAGALIFGKSRR